MFRKAAKVATLATMLAVGLSVSGASADEWPSKPITLIYPFGAGDADILGRAVADTVEKAFGQPVTMVHKPGAGGVVGGTAAANAPADGHTIFYGTVGSLSGVTELYENPPYVPKDAFDPIIHIGDFPLWLFVRNDLPFTTLEELVAYAKEHPGELNVGVAHTTGRLLTALFENGADVDMNWINYKTDPDVMPDMLAGRVDVYWGTGQWLTHTENGTVRPLVSATAKRSPKTPDVPTLEEAGLEALPINIYVGIAAPKGTPPEILAKYNAALNEGMKTNPIFEKAFAFLRLVVADENTPEDFGRLMSRSAEGYKIAVPLAGITKQ